MVLALAAAALAGGVFLVLAPALLALMPGADIPPFGEQHQDAESLIYLLAFAVILPASAWAALRFEGYSGDPSRFETAAAVSIGSLAACLVAIRLLVEAGLDQPVATALAGLLCLAVSAVVFLRPGPPDLSARPVWTAALVMILAAAATVVSWGSLDKSVLLAATALGLLTLALVQGRPGSVTPPAWAGRVFDLAVVLLVLLAVPDTMIVYPEAAATDPTAALDTRVLQFHQNLFLGATTQVLEGQGMLVGTVSQYGVASIYLIAAFFELVPISHGTLGFLDGILTALCFAAGYVTLRMAGTSRALAASTLLVGVLALAWGSAYPQGSLLQHGAIRFGMPMLLVPLAVAAGLRPQHARPFRIACLAVVGLSSIWALESFLYVSVTWAGIVLVSLVRVEPGRRWRALGREALLTLGSMVAFQIGFALLTLVAFGSLPDWGAYLTYLREFLLGDIGDLTYDFAPFSPGLAVAFAYLASAAGVIALAVRGVLRDRPATLIALAALTAYGIALFSYFDNRSLWHILSYVSLPAVLLAGLWLELAFERSSGFGRFARSAVGVAAVLGAAVLVAVAWPTSRDRAPDSVLAVALPGGATPGERWQRLKHPPELVPGAEEGRRLIEEHFPEGGEAAVVTAPDLDVNILVRSGRANALGITDSKEASWVPGPHLEELTRRVDGFEPGRLMLVDAAALEAWRALRADPDADAARIAEEAGITSIGVEALRLIAERFRLVTVERGADGLAVVRLEPLS